MFPLSYDHREIASPEPGPRSAAASGANCVIVSKNRNRAPAFAGRLGRVPLREAERPMRTTEYPTNGSFPLRREVKWSSLTAD